MKHNTNNCFIDSVIKKSLYETSLKKIDSIIDKIKNTKDPLFKSFLNQFDIYEKKKINKLAIYHQKNFKDVIILGTGGSSKAGRTFVQIAYRTFGRHPKFPKITFLENIDFQDFNDLFKKINLKKTGVIVISKSGETNETLVQFLVFLSKYRTNFKKKKIQNHFTVITKKGQSSLRDLANNFSINVLDLDSNLSGRFSAFSPVGLLPAAISGLNIRRIMDGAISFLNKSLKKQEKIAFEGAALHFAAQKSKINISVLLTYTERLRNFGYWHEQLIAESLGKNNSGFTPIHSMGATDQHSLLQLFLEGPRDKLITFITLKKQKDQIKINSDLIQNIKKLSFLKKKSLNKLLDFEMDKVCNLLKEYKKPYRTITLKKCDEYEIGYLMMNFMIETITLAYLNNLNPFDQPAIDKGKSIKIR
ncbi:MAG: Glucose-6-phosphate isomerase [Alphaproteobacteria bacterium MarineAlpha6_Bin3]|nr:MAG: Glucose-6-phosphate isomerase [Alphaproteobacteria bacterium MarineAlpha6_Bin3]|tara:strand:+ start:7988 stop:9241 length:1254 start_codon:yes stop_codon:yes gene_type:complete